MSRTLSAMALAALFVGTAANDGSTNATGIAGPFIPNDQVQMVTQDLRIKIYDRYSDFEVRYLFRNHGPQTTVGMAFPVEGYNFGPPVVLRFESWVDGRKVPVTYQTLTESPHFDDFTARYFKQVSFDENQELNVRVKYRALNGGDAMGFKDVGYVLEPGATWQGVLEKCDVRIDWSSVTQGISPFIRFLPEDGVSHRPTIRD